MKPATTFFLRVVARPFANNNTDICETDACGSTELSFTTLPEPAEHPAPPAQPLSFNANQPDTSGYVTLTVSQLPEGKCNLQQLIDGASYGTIIELPQGMVCFTDNTPANDRRGFGLRGKPLDPNAGGDINSPNHRWIIIRTANSPVDLTPSGVRVTPQTAGPFAKLVAQKAAGTGGEVFFSDHYTTVPHHYRIEALEITHTGSTELFPPDGVDPAPMNSLITLWAHLTPPTTIPNYFIFDRLYIHGLGFPARLRNGMWLNGKYVALTNSYIDKVDYWRPYQWPDAPPVLSADRLTLTAPSKSYRRNQNDSPWTMGGVATAQLQADPSYTGSFVGYVGPDGLTIEYTDSALATITCTNCNAVKKTPPAVPYNRYYWFAGTFTGGLFTITVTRYAPWETSLYATEGSTGIYGTDGAGPYLVENNHVEAYGIAYFIDGGQASPNPSDIVFRYNHMFWNQDHRITSATSNGFNYSVRNLWEIKRGARVLIAGNLFEGNWSNVNQGSTINISSRPSTKASWEQGVWDVTVKNNIIRNSSAGLYCQGTSEVVNSPPSTGPVLIANNLMYGINQFEQNASSPNGIGDNIRILNGCHDVAVRNNTFGSNIGKRPTQLVSGAGLWNEGLAFVDNLLYLNLGEFNSGGLTVDPSTDSFFPYIPAMTQGTYKNNLDKAYIRIGAAVELSYTFTNNVIVGGVKGASAAALTDITASELTTYKVQYPGGNLFPDGATKAQREAVVKFTDVARNNYRLRPDSPYRAGGANPATNGKDIGVNQDELEAAMGIVTNVAPVVAGSGSATFSYTAPDGRGCWVETSADQFATFTRTHDGGGNRARVVTLQGLLPAAIYSYRILCYFEQFNDSLHPAFPSDQNTNGTFTTLAGGGVAGTLAVAMVPPPGLGVNNVVAEYGGTSQLGAVTSPVPCSGGCTVQIPSSSSQPVYYRVKYRDVSGAVLRSGVLESAVPRQ